MESLEDEAELRETELREIAVGEGVETSPHQLYATARRRIQAADESCRRVDFPLPDGPTMATYSPGSIRSEAPRRARTVSPFIG